MIIRQTVEPKHRQTHRSRVVGRLAVSPAIRSSSLAATCSRPGYPCQPLLFRATNVDALPGRRALTLTPVDDRSGQVKLAGETWTARAADRSATIPADTDVVVVRIEGATAVVAPEPDATP